MKFESSPHMITIFCQNQEQQIFEKTKQKHKTIFYFHSRWKEYHDGMKSENPQFNAGTAQRRKKRNSRSFNVSPFSQAFNLMVWKNVCCETLPVVGYINFNGPPPRERSSLMLGCCVLERLATQKKRIEVHRHSIT